MSHDENKIRENAYKEQQDDVQRTLVWTPPTPEEIQQPTMQQPSISIDMDEQEVVVADDTITLRDPVVAAASPATAAVAAPAQAATTVNVNVTMSEQDMPFEQPKSYHKAASFEQRDEQRSAFSIVKQDDELDALDVQTAEAVVREDKQDQNQASQAAKSAERSTSELSRDPDQPGGGNMPHRVAGATRPGGGEPLPYTSPLRYYHEHPSSEDRPASEVKEAKNPEASYQYQQHHHQYPPQGYQHHPSYQNPPSHQYQYYPPGGYYQYPTMPPPEDRNTSPVTASQYHQHPNHYPSHPSYHHHSQEYGTHHAQEYGTGSPYSYYPPSGQHQYSYHHQPGYYDHHHHHPGATPPSSQSAQDTLKDPPLSAITASTRGTTPSSAARKPSDGGEGTEDNTARVVGTGGTREGTEVLDISVAPSLPSMEEDDRKPAAITTGTSASVDGTPASAAGGTSTPNASTAAARPIKGILKKESPPQGQGSEYEPIPLDQIAAIPVLSDAGTGHASPYPGAASPYSHPHHYGAPYHHPHHHGSAYHVHAHGQQYHAGYPPQAVSTPPPIDPFAAPRPPPRSAASAPVASSASASRVAPPRSAPTMTTRRRQQQQLQRTIAPSSSGSTTSSAGGGEGGSWERRFNELIEFKRQHGHCEVPQNYAENTSLGTWVNKQRMEQKNRTEGKNSSLNDSRLERLQSIGFRWAKRKGQASWNEKFNELVAYKNKFGNCHVPTKYKDNTALGRWVSTQRAEYKKYQEGQVKTSMNADKIRRLESIGFAWFMAL